MRWNSTASAELNGKGSCDRAGRFVLAQKRLLVNQKKGQRHAAGAAASGLQVSTRRGERETRSQVRRIHGMGMSGKATRNCTNRSRSWDDFRMGLPKFKCRILELAKANTASPWSSSPRNRGTPPRAWTGAGRRHRPDARQSPAPRTSGSTRSRVGCWAAT